MYILNQYYWILWTKTKQTTKYYKTILRSYNSSMQILTDYKGNVLIWSNKSSEIYFFWIKISQPYFSQSCLKALQVLSFKFLVDDIVEHLSQSFWFIQNFVDNNWWDCSISQFQGSSSRNLILWNSNKERRINYKLDEQYCCSYYLW